MIVVRLFGGLGNQLFQYAAARALAVRHGSPLALDLRWFGSQDLRAPDLCRLRIRAAPADRGDLLRGIRDDWTGPGPRSRALAAVTAALGRWHLLAERVPGVVDERVLTAPDRTQLVGYWQSDRYFAGHLELLRDELAPADPPSEAFRAARAELAATGAVSVHVRRGDLASDAATGRQHGLCTPDYYRRALEVLDERLGSPPYALFSDDPAWAVANIRHPRLRPAPTPATPGHPHEDLHLMAACRAHVVANSSYSWWGAYLGSHPDKVVVAPTTWFADPSLRSDDIVPSSWTRV